jgi:hypothetical protein
LTDKLNEKFEPVDNSVVYNELLSVNNLRGYLCRNSELSLNRINFHEKLGEFDPIKEHLVCEVIVYMENSMLLVALHHHFPLESEKSITFEKDRPIDTSFELTFQDELVGLDTRTVLYYSEELIGGF